MRESNPPILKEAKAFLSENPTETIALSGRLHKVNESTLRSSIRRDKKARKEPRKSHGGHNRVLSQVQEEAIFRYIREMYYAGFGATKPMVLGVISAIRAVEGHPPPSRTWFRSWILSNKDTIRTIRTKVIQRSRITAQDEQDVSDWFVEYRKCVQSLDVKRGDIWNFDETGF
jgi:hypothetical protein